MNKVMCKVVILVAMLAMIFGFPYVTNATLVVDQQNVIDASGSGWDHVELFQLTTNSFDEYAQTFTVGVGGTLSRVDVEAYHTPDTGGPMIVEIWDTTAGGLPDPSASLASWSISDVNSSLTPGSFVSYDLGAEAFTVLPGEIYAIVFYSSISNSYPVQGRRLVSGTTDTYSGGSSFYRTIDSGYNGLTSFASGSVDYGFRTFVDVIATPNPPPCSFSGLD